MAQWLIADISLLDASLDASGYGHHLALVSLCLGDAVTPVDAKLSPNEEPACASSPRHVLSCCYRCWDQDQISLVRARATDGFAVPPQAAAGVAPESLS